MVFILKFFFFSNAVQTQQNRASLFNICLFFFLFEFLNAKIIISLLYELILKKKINHRMSFFLHTKFRGAERVLISRHVAGTRPGKFHKTH